jgi:YbbR domain-containing protein
MSSASDVRSFRVNPSEVEVTILGDPKLIEAVLAKEIHPMVDVTGVETARDLRKRIDVATPPGITHVRVHPPEVEIIYPVRQP